MAFSITTQCSVCFKEGWFIGETTSAFEVRDEKTNELICTVNRTKAK